MPTLVAHSCHPTSAELGLCHEVSCQLLGPPVELWLFVFMLLEKAVHSSRSTVCVCVGGSSPKSLQVSPREGTQMPGCPKQEVYPGKDPGPLGEAACGLASPTQAVTAADLRPPLLPTLGPQLLPSSPAECPQTRSWTRLGVLSPVDRLQMKPALVGDRQFISALTSLDARERPSLSLPSERESPLPDPQRERLVVPPLG